MTERRDKGIVLPPGMTWLDSQVAGHQSNPSKKYIKMIKTADGCVLKAGQKVQLHEREVNFYEKIKKSGDPMHKELSTLMSKYYGVRDLELGNQNLQFIALEDVTAGMVEPCVMDVKIGRRTWDPIANASKKKAEENKYAESKRAHGLCIPGFQVYDLSKRDLRKFGKDYGKRLNGETFIEALKTFLNVENCDHIPETLLPELISSLRKIEDFFKRQKSLRFYSSSILVAYDAHNLREIKNFSFSAGTESPQVTCSLRVRMIDFTHIFEADEDGLDLNYLEGLSNLIKLLESIR